MQAILDSVIQALFEDSSRRFVYAETAYFARWWRQQSITLQSKVRVLVNEGRLEFVGGGWSLNDEAVASYQSIIDQFTWGLKFLNATFGECGRPRIGWQIDAYGHSKEQASVFAQMGYDGLFFSRLDFQDKSNRMSEQTMEMIWESNPNLGESFHRNLNFKTLDESL